jgi:hypothetical protein
MWQPKAFQESVTPCSVRCRRMWRTGGRLRVPRESKQPGMVLNGRLATIVAGASYGDDNGVRRLRPPGSTRATIVAGAPRPDGRGALRASHAGIKPAACDASPPRNSRRRARRVRPRSLAECA